MKNWVWFNCGREGGKLGTDHLPDGVVKQSVEFYITMSGPIDENPRLGELVVGCLLNNGQDDCEIFRNEDRKYVAAILRKAIEMIENNDIILQGTDEHSSSLAL